MIERICNECGCGKPLTREYFEWDKRSAGSYRVVCKACRNAAKRERAQGIYRGKREPVPKLTSAEELRQQEERRAVEAWRSAAWPVCEPARFGVPMIGAAA